MECSVSWDHVTKKIAVFERIDTLHTLYRDNVGDSLAVALPQEYNLLGHTLYASYAAGILKLTIKNWLTIRFPLGKGSTVATITVNSRPFWVRTVEDIVNELQSWCDWFFSTRDITVKFSRGDLCADFVGLRSWLLWSDKDVRRIAVTRARAKAAYSAAQEDDAITPECAAYGTGFTIGKGDVGFRFYDKLAELAHSRKDNYYAPLWQSNGYEGGEVQRAEFQLRRKFFRSWVIPETGEKLNTIQDFASQVAAIWQYLTRQWLRLVEPSDTDTNKRRAPMRLDWHIVSRAFNLPAQASEGVRMKRHHERRVHAMKQQMVGVFLAGAVSEDHGWCHQPEYYRAKMLDWLDEIADEKQLTIPEMARRAFLAIEGSVNRASA